MEGGKKRVREWECVYVRDREGEMWVGDKRLQWVGFFEIHSASLYSRSA